MRNLTKKTYLGEGYIHKFRNEKTGLLVYVPCTQKEYESMCTEGGSQYNPTLDGHVWLSSAGGTYKVDNPNETLGDDEYIVVGDKYIVSLAGKSEKETLQKVEPAEIENEAINK